MLFTLCIDEKAYLNYWDVSMWHDQCRKQSLDESDTDVDIVTLGPLYKAPYYKCCNMPLLCSTSR